MLLNQITVGQVVAYRGASTPEIWDEHVRVLEIDEKLIRVLEDNGRQWWMLPSVVVPVRDRCVCDTCCPRR
jgi:hypothetical protein